MLNGAEPPQEVPPVVVIADSAIEYPAPAGMAPIVVEIVEPTVLIVAFPGICRASATVPEPIFRDPGGPSHAVAPKIRQAAAAARKVADRRLVVRIASVRLQTEFPSRARPVGRQCARCVVLLKKPGPDGSGFRRSPAGFRMPVNRTRRRRLQHCCDRRGKS